MKCNAMPQISFWGMSACSSSSAWKSPVVSAMAHRRHNSRSICMMRSFFPYVETEKWKEERLLVLSSHCMLMSVTSRRGFCRPVSYTYSCIDRCVCSLCVYGCKRRNMHAVTTLDFLRTTTPGMCVACMHALLWNTVSCLTT